MFFSKKDFEVGNGKNICVTNSNSAYLAEFLKNITKLFIITIKSSFPNFADERRI